MMSLFDHEITFVFAKSFILYLELLIRDRIASGVTEAAKSCSFLLNVIVLGNARSLDGLFYISGTFTVFKVEIGVFV